MPSKQSFTKHKIGHCLKTKRINLEQLVRVRLSHRYRKRELVTLGTGWKITYDQIIIHGAQARTKSFFGSKISKVRELRVISGGRVQSQAVKVGKNES